jgi:nicotinate-nucleotide adenylyltransferase
MAELVLEKFGFDKILFIPAYIPPHKEVDSNLAEHRFNMVKLAVSNNKKFEISDIEYKTEGKSYSVNTVKKIIEQYNIKGRLDFIIGADAFVKIESWYKAEELKKLVHFIVFPRRGEGNKEIFSQLHQKGWNFELINCPPMDISSTDIRNLAKKDLNEKVKEYIEENGLYKS